MTPIKAGLLGRPLKSSLSPTLFGIFSRRLGETFSYHTLETGPAGLERALRAIKESGWRGFNVTIPLKEAVLPFLDSLSREASAIGAVNAVAVRGKTLKGYNTDAFAVKAALKEAGCRPKGRTCVIWGAGGAARAAAWVLAGAGAAKIAVCGRTPGRARGLAGHFSRLFPRVRFTAGTFSCAPRGAAIFVNATPMGMYAPLAPALRLEGPPGSLYMDFAYPPKPRRGPRRLRAATPFLERRSGKVVPGIDLLIYQALKSAGLFGAAPAAGGDIAALKDGIKAALSRAGRIGPN